MGKILDVVSRCGIPDRSGLRSMWYVGLGAEGSMFLIRVSLCSSCIVLCRLFSILRSYINRRSRILALEKSLIAIRPRVRSCWGMGRPHGVACTGFGRFRNLASAGNGSDLLASWIASNVWFWIRSARFSRHDRLTMRSARMDSILVWGASSSMRASRWRSYSCWLSVMITSWVADRPCFRAFWATAALPFWVFGPVDFWAFRRFAWILA